MRSLWNEDEARRCGDDPVKLRVYTSRLLGRESALVLHGGGNTSVKAAVPNLFGDREDLLYVKGSGWDLATIEAPGFAPVRRDVLVQLAGLEKLSDTDMVKMQKSAMTDPGAPAPSVEAILHAIIPFRYVDHTHADAVVAVTNTDRGEEKIREIYGDRVMIVPYIMPGFILARQVYEMTRSIDWKRVDGLILMNHGVFTFADDARTSYERMIEIVTKAEVYVARKGAGTGGSAEPKGSPDLRLLAKLRKEVSRCKGSAMVARLDTSKEAVAFANHPKVGEIATRGPLTPDHVIRTKRIPLMVGPDVEAGVDTFAREYRKYFDRNTDGKLTCLDPAPRWAVWPEFGTVSFGVSVKDADIAADIVSHTREAILWGEGLGGYRALSEKEIFEVEYWELEQAKLKKGGSAPPLQGKIALVTGAASGIGKACVEAFSEKGVAVSALDLNPNVASMFKKSSVLGIVCDVTRGEQLQDAVARTVARFGGIDIVVTNAGSFPAGRNIADLDAETWNKTIDLNLSSHQRLLHDCIPYLELGIDPAIIVIASKNVPAPGPGAAAYSAAKAGLTQLARVAALELGKKGIRVNVLHPNQVFDTGIWTPEVLENRAAHYGLSVQEYKTNNVLGVEVTSKDVAELVCAMAGPLFAKTTGAQIPVDGGNDRVI